MHKNKHAGGCECKCRFVSTSNGHWGFVCSERCDDFFNFRSKIPAILKKCPDRYDNKDQERKLCDNYKGCADENCNGAHLPGCRGIKVGKKEISGKGKGKKSKAKKGKGKDKK